MKTYSCDSKISLVATAHRGFTLIEVLVTLAIVAMLASMAMPLAELSVKRSHEQELRRSLREIRTAIDAYKQAVDEGRIQKMVGTSGYPKSLELLVEGVEDAKSPTKSRIYFLRRIPRDPFVSDTSLKPVETWGKRSYASPPDDPKTGDDVFDVYSLQAGVGINGIPYREW
ncbi:MAG: type II secretion system protein [Gallionella sp.]|nr:type II secretion system protein [Gallionella sp.]